MILKKYLLLLPVLLIAGCATGTFTRLTPNEQLRNANGLYPVEFAFDSQQQTLRWDSIKAYVLVDGKSYPMSQEPIVQNRWQGFVPLSATENTATYRFKFDYLYNKFAGQPQPNSETSKPFVLKVLDQ